MWLKHIMRASNLPVRTKAICLLGLLLHPIQGGRWFCFLRNDSMLWRLATTHSRLSIKIFRPYLSIRLSCGDKVNVLIEHYTILFKLGFRDLISNMAVAPLTVCEFTGKSDNAYRLELSNIAMENREGELSLELFLNDSLLFRGTFIFFLADGEQNVQLGVLQGIRSADAASMVRCATHDFYGCRPKNLITMVIREIGVYFSCTNFIGISNSNRIAARGQTRRDILPDYDNTWKEMRAQKSASGDFFLSCSGCLSTDLSLIRSSKRSQAKKRNELLKSIFFSVRQSLDEQRNFGSRLVSQDCISFEDLATVSAVDS